MKISIRTFTFAIYAMLSIGVSFYAFNYILQPINPYDDFQAKMFKAGWIPPTHFFAGGLALFLTPIQLSKKLRNHSVKLHRTIGMLYVLSVVIGGLTGVQMAVNASGGLMAQWGFFNLAIIWLVSTSLAFYFAIKGNITKHRLWIYRSVAITASAISLRIFLGVGIALFKLPFFTVYVPSAWLCWIINLMICEWLLYRRGYAYKDKKTTSNFA